MPVGWLLSILKREQTDGVHCDGNVTITRLQDCPRKWFIRDFLPVSFDARASNAMHVGTQVHSAIEKGTPPGQYAELKLSVPGKPLPVLFGIPMQGVVDNLTPDLSVLCDYKFHGDRSQQFKVDKGKLVDDDLTCQLNMGRLLVNQVVGKEVVKRLCVWHGAMTVAGKAAWHFVEVPVRSEEGMLSVRPRGGQHTIREIVDMVKNALQLLSDGCDARDVISGIPLVGRNMFPNWKTGQGQMCGRYCQPGVKRECDRLEGLASWK
jgi:hypothetical protein